MQHAMTDSRPKQVPSLPATCDALVLHTLRAKYQGGHMWGQADSIVTDMPSPAHWGWTKRVEVWTPQWTTQLAVWQASENY